MYFAQIYDTPMRVMRTTAPERSEAGSPGSSGSALPGSLNEHAEIALAG
jgi:hypothetical protein